MNLVVAGRRCLVVGGGPVAARKAAGLLECGAHVHLVAIEVGPEVRALATGPAAARAPDRPPATSPQADVPPGATMGADGTGVGSRPAPGEGPLGLPTLTWEERPFRSADLAGAHLVLVAVDDPAVSRMVAAEAAAAGVWVNVADDPAACSFTLPSVLRQGPVQVAVATGGHSPALAAWLRDRLAGEVGPEYGVLAGLLSGARQELRAAARPTEGLDWQSALDSDMLELIRAGRIEQAREQLRACLSLS